MFVETLSCYRLYSFGIRLLYSLCDLPSHFFLQRRHLLFSRCFHSLFSCSLPWCKCSALQWWEILFQDADFFCVALSMIGSICLLNSNNAFHFPFFSFAAPKNPSYFCFLTPRYFHSDSLRYWWFLWCLTSFFLYKLSIESLGRKNSRMVISFLLHRFFDFSPLYFSRGIFLCILISMLPKDVLFVSRFCYLFWN